MKYHLLKLIKLHSQNCKFQLVNDNETNCNL